MEQSATYQTKRNKFVMYLVLMLPVIKDGHSVRSKEMQMQHRKLICWLWLIMSLNSPLPPPYRITWLLLIKNRMQLPLVCNVT